MRFWAANALSNHRSHGTMKLFIKLPFLSIPPSSLSGISRWVDQTRFVTDCEFLFSSGQFHYYFIINFFNFGTKVSRRLPFITLSAIFPKIATATHGKWTKTTISPNPQSWPVLVTFELRKWKIPSVQRYTKGRQRMISNRGCARWLAHRT